MQKGFWDNEISDGHEKVRGARIMSHPENSGGSDMPYPPLFPIVVYQTLARQITEGRKVRCGLCLDIGSGVGMLGIEIAKIAQLEVILLDTEKNLLMGGLKNAEHFRVRERVSAIQADVHNLPFKPNSLNLIVSRGSIPFWKDRIKAFKEIYRVLAANGVAFIGGGLPKNLPEKLRKDLEKRIRDFFSGPGGRGYSPPERWRLHDWLIKAGISQFKIIEGCPGRWVEIIKS